MVNFNCLPKEMLTWFSICFNADTYDLQSVCARTFSYGSFCITAAGFPLFRSCRVSVTLNSFSWTMTSHTVPTAQCTRVDGSNPIKRRVVCPQACGQSILEEWQHNKDYQFAFTISPAWSMWIRVMPHVPLGLLLALLCLVNESIHTHLCTPAHRNMSAHTKSQK